MSIALISNTTMTSIAMKASRSTREDVYYPLGRSAWMVGLADRESKLYQCEPDCVFIILHGRTLLGEGGISSIEAAQTAILPVVDIIRTAAAEHGEITFVVSSIEIPLLKIHPLVSNRPEPQAEALWRRSIEEIGLPILELSNICTEMGRSNFYNNRLWYMGNMPFSKAAEDAIASEMERIWRALTSTRRRCLVLDLDNTLWGGEVRELGTDGVHLDIAGSGSRFVDLQRRILDLKESGVMLAVISKGDIEKELRCINEHPCMLLRESDFAAIRVNGEPKPANLESIALELGIGIDSFVFIDNNPTEREIMEIALPSVAVPTPPEDSAQLETFMIGVARQYFLQRKRGAPL
ncbi:MAG: HAD-IIIC family phosphatase [Synergistaceae bacterium]|jgi:HAD superfamily phosphatase (TIGR01681 family)|nr:HAD-IIIC family phosphatase [Synergistaceae bacterium]